MYLRLLLAASLICPVSMMGQENATVVDELSGMEEQPSPRIITNAQMVALGAANILDTYLSPEKYRGTAITYLSHTVRQHPDARWSQQIVYRGDIAYTDNRAGNANILMGMFDFSYGLHHNWSLLGGRLSVKAGAVGTLNAGFLYSTRNGNNPAQMRLGLDISPSAAASYRFAMAGKQCRVGYELAIPVLGVMFSPNYGQSYYEIFSRGNYDHNVVPTTFVSAPSLRQMLTFDITFGHNALRLGYLGDIEQAKENNLKYHAYTHSLVIGVVRKFSIKRMRP